jgi:hypothetical protein
MATAQHNDESAAAADSSRPDDPAAAAAAAGRVVSEHSSDKQHQHQPSQRHNRGPPLDDNNDGLAGDLLIGAGPIEDYLKTLGVPRPDAYYLKRSGKLPIGKYGAHLIASKRKLARHTQKITTPASAT